MVVPFAAKATWTLLHRHVRKNLLNTLPLILSNVTMNPSNGLLPLDCLTVPPHQQSHARAPQVLSEMGPPWVE